MVACNPLADEFLSQQLPLLQEFSDTDWLNDLQPDVARSQTGFPILTYAPLAISRTICQFVSICLPHIQSGPKSMPPYQIIYFSIPSKDVEKYESFPWHVQLTNWLRQRCIYLLGSWRGIDPVQEMSTRAWRHNNRVRWSCNLTNCTIVIWQSAEIICSLCDSLTYR